MAKKNTNTNSKNEELNSIDLLTNIKKLVQSKNILDETNYIDKKKNECTLILPEEKDNYEFKIKGINIKETLVIKPEIILQITKPFNKKNSISSNPDYLIFTQDNNFEPILLILELKKTCDSSDNCHIANQLTAGLALSKVIEQYLKIYYKQNIAKVYKKVGFYKVIVTTERRSTRIDNSYINQKPILCNFDKESLHETPNNQDPNKKFVNDIYGSEIHFNKILQKSRFLEIV